MVIEFGQLYTSTKQNTILLLLGSVGRHFKINFVCEVILILFVRSEVSTASMNYQLKSMIGYRSTFSHIPKTI